MEKTLTEKLAEVMAEIAYVQKGSTNDHHGYSYASAEAVLRKFNAALSSRGLALSTQSELLHYGAGASGKPSAVVRLTITVTDGKDAMSGQGIGEGTDKGDKSVMKANTAAMKYAVASMFAISWGDDPEADPGTDRDAADRPQPHSTSSPSSKRKKEPAAETFENPDDISKAIKECSSLDELQAVRNRVKAMIGHESFPKLRQEYRSREAELS